MKRFNRGLACAAVVSLVAVGVTAKHYAQSPAATRFAITNVTVIDIENGRRLPDQTVVVTGNRISDAGASSQVAVPSGARTIDGRGKFLIPGLWDMHVHSFENLGIDYGPDMQPFKLYVAHGVTGVRDMGSSYIQMVVGRRRIESGSLVAPRIVASGPLLEGGQPVLIRAIISKYVPTPEAGKLAVDALADAGVDFLKIHDGLTRETYFAIADEAKRKNMIFAGHVPESVSVVEASNVGQRSIEHLAPLIRVCADAASLRGVENNPNQPIQLNRNECTDALRRLAANGTWLTPTIISGFPQTAANTPDIESQRRYLKPDRRAACPALPAQERPGARVRHEMNMQIVKMAAEAGVRMMTGTDTTVCREPGFALIQEVTLFVAAGLSPLDALRTATINPAIYLGKEDSLGTVARGKLADLVLLNTDPLLDIQNIKHINSVSVNGRLFDSAGREQLLNDVLASAGSSN